MSSGETSTTSDSAKDPGVRSMNSPAPSGSAKTKSARVPSVVIVATSSRSPPRGRRTIVGFTVDAIPPPSLVAASPSPQDHYYKYHPCHQRPYCPAVGHIKHPTRAAEALSQTQEAAAEQ